MAVSACVGPMLAAPAPLGGIHHLLVATILVVSDSEYCCLMLHELVADNKTNIWFVIPDPNPQYTLVTKSVPLPCLSDSEYVLMCALESMQSFDDYNSKLQR